MAERREGATGLAGLDWTIDVMVAARPAPPTVTALGNFAPYSKGAKEWTRASKEEFLTGATVSVS